MYKDREKYGFYKQSSAWIKSSFQEAPGTTSFSYPLPVSLSQYHVLLFACFLIPFTHNFNKINALSPSLLPFHCRVPAQTLIILLHALGRCFLLIQLTIKKKKDV